jgi:hypothetical protein
LNNTAVELYKYVTLNGSSAFLNSNGTRVVIELLPPPVRVGGIHRRSQGILTIPNLGSYPERDDPSQSNLYGNADYYPVVSPPTGIKVYVKTPDLYLEECQLHVTFRIVGAARISHDDIGLTLQFSAGNWMTPTTYSLETGIGEFQSPDCLNFANYLVYRDEASSHLTAKVSSSILNIESVEISFKLHAVTIPDTTNTIQLHTPTRALAPGNIFALDFKSLASETIGGFQIEFTYDPTILTYAEISCPSPFDIGSAFINLSATSAHASFLHVMNDTFVSVIDALAPERLCKV